MISVLIDAAFRSFLIGVVVAAGLRVFRIRNVFAKKTALGLVLIGALAMPLLMQVTDRFGLKPRNANIILPAHSMTLLQELQAKLQARSGTATVPKLVAEPLPAPNPAPTEKPSSHSASPASAFHARDVKLSGTTLAPEQKISFTRKSLVVEPAHPSPQPNSFLLSASSVSLSIYLAVAAVLLLRIIFGLAITLRLWLNATPIRQNHFEISISSRQLRDIVASDHRLGNPVTGRL